MMLVLTCALCATQPALPAEREAGPDRPALLGERLSPPELGFAGPSAPSPMALGRAEGAGSGEGDGHSSYMAPMWIAMGVMMVAMMVVMGVYVAGHGSGAQALHPAASTSPAQLALPVAPMRGGGG
ncbi:hypothetical protein [Anaeromyxobacter terrae]|uniref:hypothetical protein n=1 Tax=Anaeromyxobacter terrae TaxID=2925406 RepID=UPI001F5A7FE4|nr:hypothetical protein [Anaeromyxobacter sp. SG22]